VTRASRLIANASFTFGAAVVIKVLDLLVMILASRYVGFEVVGLAFVAESIASVTFAMGDFGLRTVLTRRTARGQVTRQTVLRALGLRATAVLLCFGAVSLALGALARDLALPLCGFLLGWALFHVHDVGRAVLFGQERFALNAALAVTARLVGAAVAVLGVVASASILWWVLGKLVAEALQLVMVGAFAWRRLPEVAADADRPLVREGIAFWGRQTVDVLNGHLEVLLVTLLLGLQGAAYFGVAARVLGGGLLVVGSLSAVAFPELARRRTEPLRWCHLAAIGALALVMAWGIAAIGPFVVRPLFADWTASGDLTLRVLAVALLFITLYQPTAVWLEAHDRELRVLVVNALALPISVVALVLLVPLWGAAGAAAAAAVRTFSQAVGAIGQAVALSRQLGRGGDSGGPPTPAPRAAPG
jgi:O-antigen/teichoic acid export membrane protein